MRHRRARQWGAIVAVVVAVAIAMTAELRQPPMRQTARNVAKGPAVQVELRSCGQEERCATVGITIVVAPAERDARSEDQTVIEPPETTRLDDRLIDLLLEIAHRLLFV